MEKIQLQDGFNKSRKLQKDLALKLQEEASVEINEYENDLGDVNCICKLFKYRDYYRFWAVQWNNIYC